MNTIRTYEPTDDYHILSLLKNLKIDPDSGYAEFGIEGSPNLETIILEREGVFAGLGSVWTKDLHNKRLYINTYHQEDGHCADGLDSLCTELFSIRDKKFPQLMFQAAYPSHLKKHLNFYLRKGFKETMKTYNVEIPIHELRLIHQLSEDGGIAVESLKNSVRYSNNKESILDSLISNYSLNHKHNPPKEVEREFWSNHYLGEDLLLEYSFLILRNDEIVGVLLSQKTQNLKTIFVETIIFDVNPLNTALSASSLLDSLLRKLGKGRVFEAVSFELDDTDPSSKEVLSQLNVEKMMKKSEILVTLQESSFIQ